MTAGLELGLTGRVALVTGANHGIGAAIARGLGAHGAGVLLTFLRIEPETSPAGTTAAYARARASSAEPVAEAIRAAGGRALAVEADLADERTIPALFDRCERELGPVEILVNNASGWLQDTFLPRARDRFGRVLEPVSAATVDRQLRIDARAAALLIAELARRHIERGARWGRILALSSGGPAGFPDEVSYGAAKAALENYTMSAAAELGAHGVTANALHPPATDTGWVTAAVEEAVRATSPIPHVARPEDVADVALLLLSEQARFVTANVVRMA